MYSQFSLLRTPSGPLFSVRLTVQKQGAGKPFLILGLLLVLVNIAQNQLQCSFRV